MARPITVKLFVSRVHQVATAHATAAARDDAVRGEPRQFARARRRRHLAASRHPGLRVGRGAAWGRVLARLRVALALARESE